MKIQQTLFFTGRGGRSYQEDTAFPTSESAYLAAPKPFFIVCDGMGGVEGGAAASKITTDTTIDWFLELTNALPTADGEELELLVSSLTRRAKVNLRNYAEENDISKRMGTTLAAIYVADAKVLALHCGDSRVYHLRDGQAIWQSRDHSYVNQLVDEGQIRQEEAATHPNRNILARCVSANPSTSSRADAQWISNIQAGDAFLICSDGVYGALTPQEWTAALSQYREPQALMAHLAAQAIAAEGDNFTAWLVVL